LIVARKATSGTRQLAADIDENLHARFMARKTAEQRTLRVMIERALTYFMDHVPLDDASTASKTVEGSHESGVKAPLKKGKKAE
jgi:hypothetical protein